jgi:hypothetical protein
LFTLPLSIFKFSSFNPPQSCDRWLHRSHRPSNIQPPPSSSPSPSIHTPPRTNGGGARVSNARCVALPGTSCPSPPSPVCRIQLALDAVHGSSSCDSDSNNSCSCRRSQHFLTMCSSVEVMSDPAWFSSLFR